MNAVAWMSQLSTAGRAEPKREEPPKQPLTACVDRWIDGRWVEVDLVWNGEVYEVAK